MLNWLKKIYTIFKGLNPAIGDVGVNIKPNLNLQSNVHNQLGGTTNINGLTYTEAKDLFSVLFKQNFPVLKEEAMKVCEERITNFEKEFFDKCSRKVKEDKISKFAEPDIQNDCNEITKIVATKNNSVINSLLIEILTNKINNDDELQNIASSEAMKVAGKLTEAQLKILLVVMIIVYTRYEALDIAVLEINIKELLEKLKIEYVENIDIEHLTYTGCISRLQFGQNFDKLLQNIYKDIPQIQNAHNYPNLKKLQEIWDNKNLKYIQLTSVGKVIAINYFQTIFNDKIKNIDDVFKRNKIEDK